MHKLCVHSGVDPFHVVEWATEALDKVRIAAWRRAQEAAKAVAVDRGKGRPRKEDTEAQIAAAAKKKTDQIKKSMYSLGKAPEHLTSNQAVRLEMIAKSDNQLYRAYLLKEKLRLIFQIDDVNEAEKELIAWVKWARHCRIPEFVELQRKIMRHKDHILNTIRLDVSNEIITDCQRALYQHTVSSKQCILLLLAHGRQFLQQTHFTGSLKHFIITKRICRAISGSISERPLWNWSQR